ncbi:hypothetical protein I79_026119 [Cricetulus griseus]|uniref:Uncharacterized protein n=1 Tax=Cricetulus griseus TaxID=10029 RepID=G3IQ31_CRIGR|nr:hypothetical protein I79_026119 [Cricetulus griseus]
MATMSTLLFSLLIFSVVGFFFPRHLLGWFNGQRIIFLSSETDERHTRMAGAENQGIPKEKKYSQQNKVNSNRHLRKSEIEAIIRFRRKI